MFAYGEYTLRSYTYAAYLDAQGNPLEINTEDAAQIPEGYENAGRFAANMKSENDSYFTDGGFELIEGNPIVTETGKQVLHHEKFAKRNVLKLFGGQQQRIAIARALASDAQVILADEPTGNLDEDTAAEITAILKDSAYKSGKCVVIVTHSNELAKEADVVLGLRKGELQVLHME